MRQKENEMNSIFISFRATKVHGRRSLDATRMGATNQDATIQGATNQGATNQSATNDDEGGWRSLDATRMGAFHFISFHSSLFLPHYVLLL